MFKRSITALGVSCAALFTNVAQADDINDIIEQAKIQNIQSVLAMEGDGAALQPKGQYELCLIQPSECMPFETPNAVIHITPEVWNDIESANILANTMVKQITDQEAHGTEEKWVSFNPQTARNMQGDCEDVNRLKISLLKDMGYPDSAMRLVTGFLADGGGHAVVVLKTNQGDFILDNMHDSILPVEEVAMTFRSMQSPTHSGQWEKAVLKTRRP